MTNGPVLIDLEGKTGNKTAAPEETPATAPPVPDPAPDAATRPEGRAMQRVAQITTRRPSPLMRWFWALLAALLGAILSVSAWDFATGLIARMPVLGYAVTALIALFLLVLLAIGLRELAGFARLRRMDRVHRAAAEALENEDLTSAKSVAARIDGLYRGRDELNWARARVRERAGEQFDAATLLGLVEAELIAPLDKAAIAEVETAARQVATVTALVPLALADVVAALTSNLRMIRRIAEVYGGRSGSLGSWRLVRAVMTHLVATGAVAVGDDMLGSLAGGGVLGKISRRFGEGVVNGALTARVGVAAIEVCRPLPFNQVEKPSVTALVGRALSGLFGGSFGGGKDARNDKGGEAQQG
ncbi:MAG: TIGR01620 family protein [Rhodobacterales bacterium]|nr:MAG: TIGR01620 family protein [Rhodobacterales bacterium]